MNLHGRAATANEPAVLSVPGLDGSGPDHWQTLWEASDPMMARVELGLWSAPQRGIWVERLDAAILSHDSPVILCAHSLGCLAVAWWAATAGRFSRGAVAGALLVAPPNCNTGGPEGRIGGFAPVPRLPLPFPSVVVASRDDRYSTIEWLRGLAHAWRSEFVDSGRKGHINAESGLGDWPEGRAMLDRLIAATPARTNEFA